MAFRFHSLLQTKGFFLSSVAKHYQEERYLEQNVLLFELRDGFMMQHAQFQGFFIFCLLALRNFLRCMHVGCMEIAALNALTVMGYSSLLNSKTLSLINYQNNYKFCLNILTPFFYQQTMCLCDLCNVKQRGLLETSGNSNFQSFGLFENAWRAQQCS
jgi:hypothetical protein